MTDYRIKTEPLEHQLEAIEFLYKNDYAALLDEQGVGKTKEIIDSLILMLKNDLIDNALIISPKTLTYTWEKEIHKHSYLRPGNISGTTKSKNSVLLSDPNIYILNYDSVANNITNLTYLMKTGRFAVILDESQRIKSPKSKTFQSVIPLIGLSKRRYVLSGTIVANSPLDLWAQYYFLDEGLRLGNDFTDFKKKYGTNNYKEDVLNSLNNAIRPISIRRLKKDVLQLPDKVYKTIEVEMGPDQNRLYTKAKEQLKIEILTEKGLILDDITSVLKKLLRLSQIASNPGLLDINYKETPAKFLAIDKILQEITSNDEKAILWTGYIDNIKQLKQRYRKYNPVVIHGDVPIEQRNKNVDAFQDRKDIKIMIANPSAAREGLTLTSANHAIYLDRNFNLVDYLQSQDRIHRISQQKECYIYKIKAINTIDYFIDSKLSEKQAIASLAQGDTNKLIFENKLTKEEIEELLN